MMFPGVGKEVFKLTFTYFLRFFMLTLKSNFCRKSLKKKLQKFLSYILI